MHHYSSPSHIIGALFMLFDFGTFFVLGKFSEVS